MKGRTIILDHLKDREAAALMVDGKLEDLLVEADYAIVTPEAPGLNISRAIRDEEERDRLLEIAHAEMGGAEHGLSEAEYRAMFGLPEDMPLVAPSYSKKKADYAKSAGFGKYARTGRPAADNDAKVS